MATNFEKFWQGYLLGLAFTGHKEGNENDNYDEPIFSNPGGCISEVVDVDEFEKSLGNELVGQLVDDCRGFYRDAKKWFGGEYEKAGTDFHLTRNGHGSGFWDGDYPEYDKLTKLARTYGTCELVQSSDGSFYVHN